MKRDHFSKDRLNENFIIILVFMLFSVISAIAPKIMARRFMESSKAWSANAGKYHGIYVGLSQAH